MSSDDVLLSQQLLVTLQRLSREVIQAMMTAVNLKGAAPYVSLQCALTELRRARTQLGESEYAILDHDLMPTEASTETTD